ncbi:hypothetical protein SmJEL517_g04800 [Synchytrium microbalum]|uniref:D-lactate dehydrogenase (cytochrome) n=1 Tax=Synchytrium microbalum TaxID=1806994 RepID=A0A507C1N9_9FUNG|nr:uncharacterized protein SmJEL517_g04800 [Synchytrium microbalum]TPX31994.1 hypothetical protein SmJEL517_g04800 [Synchytrium microbalum]
MRRATQLLISASVPKYVPRTSIAGHALRLASRNRHASTGSNINTQPPPPPASQNVGISILQMTLSLILGAAGGSLLLYQNRDTIFAGMKSNADFSKPKVYGGRREFDAALEKIKKIVPHDDIDLDEHQLKDHGESKWSYHNLGLPDVVVSPTTIDQVSQIIKIASEYRIPVIPYGGGTSLEGHYTAPQGGICLDMVHFDKIELHEEDMDVVVGPGVGWEYLNEVLKPSGVFFPTDPGPGAKIGGMIAVGCSGTNAVRYGTVRDWVLSLTVVMPDGSIVVTRPRVRKTSAGYNLNQLMIGSEGTLGVIVEATLKLAALPKETSIAVCDFPDIRSAANVVADVVRSGLQIGAIEILDDVMMKCINHANPRISQPERPTLYFKFSGQSKVQVDNDVKFVNDIAKKYSGGKFRFAKNEKEKADLWEGRKNALWSTVAMQPERSVWTTDVVVPVSKLPTLMEQTQADLKTSFLLAPMVGHAGDGNFHLIIMFDPKIPKEVEEATRINNNVVGRALQLGGSCTGEHGVGIGKKKYLTKELGAETLKVMWQLKETLDPYGIMNPGKVLPGLNGDADHHHH